MSVQGTPQAGSATTQHSALLHCLSQLNSDVWVQVVLPKLVEQQSVAAVAVTCSQLRDLCHSSRQSITVDVSTLFSGAKISHLESLVHNMPMHFPNCTAVSLELGTQPSYHIMPYILPALARLRQLDRLSITLPDNKQQLLTSTMLYSMRTHLPELQSLTITADDPLTGPIAGGLQRELGKITQLTKLCLNLSNSTYTDNPDTVFLVLHPLSGLQQLQHLAIWATGLEHHARKHRYTWFGGWPVIGLQPLSSLTALTRLETNICDLSCLGALSYCVSLQHLVACLEMDLMDHDEDQHELLPEEWDGLALLTQLTELRLLNAGFISASPEACNAMSKLTKLQVVAVNLWGRQFLPALAPCVQLRDMWGLGRQ